MCFILSFPLLFIFVILYFSSPLALSVSALLALSGIAAWAALNAMRNNGVCVFYDDAES